MHETPATSISCALRRSNQCSRTDSARLALVSTHTTFRSPERLAIHRNTPFQADRYKDQQDVFAITYRDDVPYLFINGYVSIPLGGALATEEVVGALSSMFAPRLDRALVLGFGSGATAGTVGLVFEETDVALGDKSGVIEAAA